MRYRVIQWSTGNVGRHALRAIIQHPDLDLVGVHAYSPTKIGKDAAELCGLAERTGVTVTGDIYKILALEADCVCYTAKGETRLKQTLSDLSQLLASGKNVVSTAPIYLVYPPHADAAMRGPLEEACRRGGTSLFVSGVDPGFSGDLLPLSALSLCERVDSVRVQELFDYSTYDDPEFTGVAFGFGRPLTYRPPLAIPGVLRMGWGGMVRMVADAVGIALEEIRESFDRRLAEQSFETKMMRVEKGTTAAVRFLVEGMVAGRPVIVAEHVNRLHPDIAPDWPMPPPGRSVHRVVIEGSPSVTLDCALQGDDGDHNTGGVTATAMRVVNSIPAVCAAKPGLLSTLDLPFTPTRRVAR
ncbi:MAG: dihydrodipicolinate reductase [Candidatus Binatia bacterium]